MAMIEIEQGHDWHVVEVTVITQDMTEWCHNRLGETGRYFLRPPRLFFRDESDHLMFVLRFS
jgi:hypothetical protein